jgi:hypothetical protein
MRRSSEDKPANANEQEEEEEGGERKGETTKQRKRGEGRERSRSLERRITNKTSGQNRKRLAMSVKL